MSSLSLGLNGFQATKNTRRKAVTEMTSKEVMSQSRNFNNMHYKHSDGIKISFPNPKDRGQLGFYLSVEWSRAAGMTPLCLGESAEKQEDTESVSPTCDRHRKEMMVPTSVSARKCCACTQDGRRQKDTLRNASLKGYWQDLVTAAGLYLAPRGSAWKDLTFVFSEPLSSHTDANSNTPPVRDLWLVVNTQHCGLASSVVCVSIQQLCVTKPPAVPPHRQNLDSLVKKKPKKLDSFPTRTSFADNDDVLWLLNR